MPIYKYNGGMGRNNKGEKMSITLNVECRFCKDREQMKVNYLDYREWRNGTLIQNAMPYLDADQRELVQSKICGRCYDEITNPQNVEVDISD